MNLITTRGARLCVGLIACNLLWVMGSAAGNGRESIVGAWLFDDGNGEIANPLSGPRN